MSTEARSNGDLVDDDDADEPVASVGDWDGGDYHPSVRPGETLRSALTGKPLERRPVPGPARMPPPPSATPPVTVTPVTAVTVEPAPAVRVRARREPDVAPVPKATRLVLPPMKVAPPFEAQLAELYGHAICDNAGEVVDLWLEDLYGEESWWIEIGCEHGTWRGKSLSQLDPGRAIMHAIDVMRDCHERLKLGTWSPRRVNTSDDPPDLAEPEAEPEADAQD